MKMHILKVTHLSKYVGLDQQGREETMAEKSYERRRGMGGRGS